MCRCLNQVLQQHESSHFHSHLRARDRRVGVGGPKRVQGHGSARKVWPHPFEEDQETQVERTKRHRWSGGWKGAALDEDPSKEHGAVYKQG